MAKRGHDSVMGEGAAAQVSTVLCCSCGVPMAPNQTMRCAQCLKAEVSIVEGISRQVALPHCRNCNRYNKPSWIIAEPESRELLGICLKRIKGIGRDVRLVDAAFIWTEEHSKRIRVKITVQKEVANGSVLQQTMVVEFTVVNQQCEECQKSFTPHAFNGIVQVRQKADHRRTFCYLEQLILKCDAHDKVVSLKEVASGLDFHFAQRSHAQRFADFVSLHVPTKQKNAKQLVSHDLNSNIYHYKYTIYLEISPVCTDDIVFVPQGHSQALSGAAPLMLCHKVSNAVRLIDPLTLRGYDIPAESYWKRPIEQVLARKHLLEFIVLNVEFVDAPEAGTPQKHSTAARCKMQLADIEVARICDFGHNDDRFIVRSHLGNALRPGNRCLGYDLRTATINGMHTESVNADAKVNQIDFILVKRHYKRRRGKRNWDLQRLDRDVDEGEVRIDDEDDMEAVKQDLEQDADLRAKVNMYRKDRNTNSGDASKAAAPADEDENDDEDEDAPEVPLAELLEGLELKD